MFPVRRIPACFVSDVDSTLITRFHHLDSHETYVSEAPRFVH
jgi:hypothetical protein